MAVIRMNFLSRSLGVQSNITAVIPSFSFADVMEGKRDVYQPGVQYQTLFLLHGGSGDDSDWLHFTSITRYADAHKLAVIMPSGGLSHYVDMAHGGKYFTYITEELPRVARAMFPLSTRREDTFVAGLSMGAGGAARVAIKRPDLVSAAVCLSGAFSAPRELMFAANEKTDKYPKFETSPDWPMPKDEDIFGDVSAFPGSEEDLLHVARRNRDEKIDTPRMFFSVGDKDFAVPGVQDFCEKLTDLGCDASFELVPGYGHEWDFWDLKIRQAIEEWLPIRHAPIYPE